MEREKIVLKSVRVDKTGLLVLCKFGNQFATWIYDEQYDTYNWGDYSETLEGGLDSFYYRAKERGVL